MNQKQNSIIRSENQLEELIHLGIWATVTGGEKSPKVSPHRSFGRGFGEVPEVFRQDPSRTRPGIFRTLPHIFPFYCLYSKRNLEIVEMGIVITITHLCKKSLQVHPQQCSEFETTSYQSKKVNWRRTPRKQVFSALSCGPRPSSD